MDCSEEVLVVLRQILRAVSIQSKKLRQTCGLTTPQLLLLKEVERRGEIATGALSANVSLSHATVTSILDRLVAKSLVERMRSPSDRRKVLIRLTQLGHESVSAAPSLLQDDFQARFGQMEPWEQTLILSSLQRVARMMRAQDLPASPLLASEEVTPPLPDR